MSELKELNQKLDKALADFKDLNDRYADLAQQGEDIAEFKAAAEKANNEVSRLIGEIKSAEEAAQNRADDLEAEINRILRASGPANDEEMTHAVNFFNSVAAERQKGAKEIKLLTPDDVDIEQYRAYKAAYADYLRFPQAQLSPDVLNALREGADADGGFFVPDEMGTRIRQRIFRTSPIRQVAEVVTIGSEAYVFLADADEATEGGYGNEQPTITNTDNAQYKKARIPVHKLWAQPIATEEVIDDATISIEGEVSRKGADKFSRVENNKFVVGTGADEPAGFLGDLYSKSTANEDDSPRLPWGTLQYVITGASAGFPKISGLANADDSGSLIEVQQALNSSYRANASWMMNRTTFATVRKLRDNDGNYLWERSHKEGAPFSLLGSPVVEAEDMPVVAADSFSIAYGDWREGYLIVERQGFRILRDPYTQKGVVKFYMTTRNGGGVQNSDAIKLLKFGTS